MWYDVVRERVGTEKEERKKEITITNNVVENHANLKSINNYFLHKVLLARVCDIVGQKI